MPNNTPSPSSDEPLDVSECMFIVTGAHLRSEIADRPLAYQLQEQINQWLADHSTEINLEIQPVVCTDIWYVNQEPLQKRPTISIGSPEVNALSAYYANRLTHAFVSEDQLMIQLDPESIDLRVCLWGMTHDLTQQALARFNEKYLPNYLQAVVTQVEPAEG